MSAAATLLVLFGGSIAGKVSLLQDLGRYRAGVCDQCYAKAECWLHGTLFQINEEIIDRADQFLGLLACLGWVTTRHHPDKGII